MTRSNNVNGGRVYSVTRITQAIQNVFVLNSQDLYGVRSDLGNLFKALGRLEDAKVGRTDKRSQEWVGAGRMFDNEFSCERCEG